MTRIPALTLWRPWPELILFYGKNIENRDWATPYRGLLLIHGGKMSDLDAVDFAADVVEARFRPGVLGMNSVSGPPGIVGVVELVAICTAGLTRSVWPGPCPCGPWAAKSARCHWQLANPRAFPAPIPCNGRQRLWQPTGETAEKVAAQLAKVGVS